MNQRNALRRDIRELQALAKKARESANVLLLGGNDDGGWGAVAEQYEEQLTRLRRLYARKIHSDGEDGNG